MKMEIEFRGKRADNKEWVYGDLLNLHNGDKYIVNNKFGACIDDKGNFINTESPFVCKVIPETVGQYTCVKDINKKKIYEYDRVKCKGVETLGTVLFDGGSFGIEFDKPIAEDWTSTALYCLINEEGFAECEVIGNIFDKEIDNGD